MDVLGVPRLWVGHDEGRAADVVPHLARHEDEADALQRIIM